MVSRDYPAYVQQARERFGIPSESSQAELDRYLAAFCGSSRTAILCATSRPGSAFLATGLLLEEGEVAIQPQRKGADLENAPHARREWLGLAPVEDRHRTRKTIGKTLYHPVSLKNLRSLPDQARNVTTF